MCQGIQNWKKKDGSLIAIDSMTQGEIEGRMKYLAARGRTGFVFGALKKQLKNLILKSHQPEVQPVRDEGSMPKSISDYRFDGKTWPEIAEIFGISVSTARRRFKAESK